MANQESEMAPHWWLVVPALLVAIAGMVFLVQGVSGNVLMNSTSLGRALLGFGLLVLACFLAILGRMVQAADTRVGTAFGRPDRFGWMRSP